MTNHAFLIISTLILFMGCERQEKINVAGLQKEILELKQRFEQIKPGLGQIMGIVQKHHEKLFFSGQNKNWTLAQFALDEIKENVERSAKLHNQFKEVKTPLTELSRMMDPSIDSMEKAIKAQNHATFLAEYENLTQSCNRCHQATGYQFIAIKTPTSPSFTNQKF